MRLIGFQEILSRYHSGESFVVFDTETTGLNTYHDDIVEVAGMTWQKNGPIENFQEICKVNLNKMSAGAWEIHKIPEEEILAAREPAEVLADFKKFCDGRTLIAHNIRFDWEMLNSNLIRAGLTPYENDHVACSYAYSREQMMPGKLGELAKHLKVEVEDGGLHRALYDVQILTHVMGKMMKKHEPEEMQYSLIL